MSSVAHAYLDEVLAIMEAHSVNRYKIDWASFRQSVSAWAGSAQTISELTASGAIPRALSLLGDHHSTYIKPDGTYISAPGGRSCSATATPGVAVPDDIGYVKIDSFGDAGDAGDAFAASIQTRIRAADRADTLGWVVDLRGNVGGNMWPMIAGVGPVLGEGTIGAFLEPSGSVRSRWEYAGGAALLAGSALARVVDPYRLARPNPKVAVLTDCGVASAGEAVVIAFHGRPGVRSFGTPTYGLTTSHEYFRLSDGALLLLADALMADRNLIPFGDVIVPDEVINDPTEAVQRAVSWLRGQ